MRLQAVKQNDVVHQPRQTLTLVQQIEHGFIFVTLAQLHQLRHHVFQRTVKGVTQILQQLLAHLMVAIQHLLRLLQFFIHQQLAILIAH